MQGNKSTIKKSNLSINPNIPGSRSMNGPSPLKSAALSDIVNQSTRNLQSPGSGGFGLSGTSNFPYSPSGNFLFNQQEVSPTPTGTRTANLGTTMATATAVAKLSKLQARKEKQNLVNTAITNRKDPSSFLNPSYDEGNNDFKYSLNSNQNVISKEIISKELEEQFKGEKKVFLSKLQEENQLLLQLLEDVQESKAAMTKRLKELEIAKDTMKALKTPSSLDAIDHYLIDECPLAENNRYELNLSAVKVQEAQKVYERLVSLMSVFKSNYTSYFEYIMEHLSDISEMFLSNQSKEMNDAIEQLEQIIMMNPNNIEAAKFLSKSLEKSLLQATSDHLQDFLRKQTTSSGGRTMKGSMQSHVVNPVPKDLATISSANPVPTATATSAPADPGYSESKNETSKYTNEEIKQILAQNESLRGTVAQLRQRLAQVRVSSVNAAAHSPLYGSPKPKGTTLGAASPLPPSSSGKGVDDISMKAGLKGINREGDGGGEPTPSGTSQRILSLEELGIMPPATATTLPESIQLLAIARLKNYLTQIISGNPALPLITSNEILKALILEEVIQQVLPSFLQFFEIALKAKKDLQFLFQSPELQQELITQEYLERDPQLILTLTEVIDETFQITHVHSELLSWLTLYCSYAYNRMGSSQSVVLEDSETQYTEEEKERLKKAYEKPVAAQAHTQAQPQAQRVPAQTLTPTPSVILTPSPALQATESLRSLSKSPSQSNVPRYMLPTKSYESNARMMENNK